MTNQFKHNSPSSALSQFNIIAALKPQTRQLVNEKFIKPIVEDFFADKGGIDNFCELDPDKLKTEIEFLREKNFVNNYIYKEIINTISKPHKQVIFKPKYVVTFDRDLVDEIDGYGVIRLGRAPIIYYILIDLQKLINFIKTLPDEPKELIISKLSNTDIEVRNRLLDNVILDKQQQLKIVDISQKVGIEHEIIRLEQVRQSDLLGHSGRLRINLAWNTTDDLDLHIISPNGTISYKNKVIENQGVIGVLDIDQNTGNNIVSNPQENINFDNIPNGLHTIYVNFYFKRERNEVPFTITIIPEDGEGRIFNKIVQGKGSNKQVVTFEYINGEIVYTELS